MAPSSILGRALDGTSSMLEEFHLRLRCHLAPGIWESAHVTVKDLIHIGTGLALPSRASEKSAILCASIQATFQARKKGVIRLRLGDLLR